MKTKVTLLALLISGCGTTWSVADDYFSVKPTVVPLVAERTSITKLEIKFHPNEPRASVAAKFSSAMSESWSNGTSQFEPRLNEFRNLYQQALMAEMKRRNLKCAITRGDPHVELFMFEFQYSCEGMR